MVEDAYKANNHGIIGKQGTNTLLAVYFSQLENRFYHNDVQYRNEIIDLYNTIVRSNSKAKNIADFLIWPMKSKISCFETLSHSDPIWSSAFGCNRLLEMLVNDKKIQEQLSFNFSLFSKNTYIASALHGTYFPIRNYDNHATFSDKFIVDILSDLLTLFFYPDLKNHHEFINVQKSLSAERDAILFFFGTQIIAY